MTPPPAERRAADGLLPLRDVLARHDLHAKRSLGQNFLHDLNLTGRIARAAGPLEGVTVLEIGPGPGGLTRALLHEGARQVVAIERDPRCLGALAEIGEHYPGRLVVYPEDALSVDHRSMIAKTAPPNSDVRIVANLPYNVATPLLTGWLSSTPRPPFYSRMVLMFQREVAERITAAPGDRAYGRLSVLAGWRCTTRRLFDIPAQAFVPPPKVISSVVELIPRAEPLPCSQRSLEAVTRAAFGQRRKMLRASLKGLVDGPAGLLAAAQIDATARAEEIDIAGFVRLANAYDAATRSGT